MRRGSSNKGALAYHRKSSTPVSFDLRTLDVGLGECGVEGEGLEQKESWTLGKMCLCRGLQVACAGPL